MAEFSVDGVVREITAERPRICYRTEAPLGEVLGRRTVKGDKLDLLNQPTAVAVYETPNAYVYSVGLSQTPIYTERLINVLTQASPFANDPESEPFVAGAIRADWDFSARADAEDLHKFHSEALKHKWHDFYDGDRLIYLRALTMADEATIASSLKSGADYKATPQAVLEKQENVRNAARKVSYHLRYGENNRSFPAYSIPQEISFDDLAPHVQEKILNGVNSGFLGKVIDSYALGSLTEPGHKSYGLDQEVYHLGSGILKVSSGDSWAKYDINHIPAVELDKKIVVDDRDMIYPWVIWARNKDAEKRVYLNGKLPDFMTDTVDPRSNQRLGFILATALSERVRGKLPKEIGLPGLEDPQKMREPQVPLLVYLFDRMLLDGRFFANVEQNSRLVTVSPEYWKEAKVVGTSARRGVHRLSRQLQRWVA